MAPSLTVVGFPPVPPLASPSPYCLKLETWLRMAGVDYEASSAFSPFEAPRGKAPYARFADGTLVGDSEAILARLRADGVDLDAHLDAEARARAVAARRVVEDHLYFVMLHERWVEDAGFAVLKGAYFGGDAAPKRWIVPQLARRSVTKTCWLHGVSRYTPEERLRMAEADLDVLELWLTATPFLGGEAPCTADASVYGVVANLLWGPFDGALKDAANARPHVVAFATRVRDRWWS